ncbi:MAG: aminoacyl-tRNA hydrolase [Myxococcota bacterium]
MHLVVGLGNPGARYAKTRHNVGFLVVERLAARANASVEKKLFGALVGDCQVAGRKVVLAMPQQYMNLSGHPTRSVMGFYKVAPTDTVVVYDDLDLPFGKLRLRTSGSAGGHNGVKDIVQHVGNEFVRVRVGIGRPPGPMDSADYVLTPWSAAEAEKLDAVVDRAADAVESVVRDGVAKAMNTFNADLPA